MRWERLFDDLEAQLDLIESEEFTAEVSDRTRRENSQVQLFDRFRRAVGAPVDLTVAGAGLTRGVLRRVGQGWLLMELAPRSEALVIGAGILAVAGLPVTAVRTGATGVVESRLDLGHAMRAVARDREQVTVVLRDGSRYIGTVDRAGADFVDLAEHSAGEPRRPNAVNSVRTVPFAAIALVRTT